jgi:predicted phage-related endonuclease
MDTLVRDQWQITSLGEWLERRRHHITASRVASLFDCHDYLSREGLAAELRGESGEVPNASMRAGNILEGGFPAAVRLDDKPWALSKADTYHWLPEHRLGCTPDFWIGDDGLFQAKTASTEQWQKWHGHPPLMYLLQTLTELIVTGRTWGVLGVMIRAGGYPIHYYEVARHEAAERRILDAVAAWWRAFDAGEFPAAAPSAEIAEMLDDGSHLDLSDNNYLCSGLLPEREKLKAELSAGEKRVSEIDSIIKAAMGNASSAWIPGYNITFRSQSRKEVIIPAKTFRVLRVRAAAEEEGADVQ